ncbi:MULTISPECIES: hypothetical protein [unclassified Bartonella]|uniref:hypothetical protein n=1 Tax=unclassified Bartonella TaxID=2645622 RepID=UPI00235EF2FE|nr:MULTISPECIES: hypothetical protein [unclassified Bartonella]
MKYFITALATFFSISIAQGASLLTSQLGQGISSTVSPENLFLQKQPNGMLSKLSQTKFSHFNDNQREAVVELVAVSSSGKRRGRWPKHPRPRPRLFNGPMSYK